MGETQERERVLAHFSQRYFQCNPEALSSEGEQVGSRVVPSVATEAHTHTRRSKCLCKRKRMSMFVRHVKCSCMHAELSMCRHVARSTVFWCSERQVEMCLHEVVPYICAGPGLASVLTDSALHTCDGYQLAFV